MAERQIYLDYAATAPLCEEARDAMQPYVSAFGNESLEFRGNANSLYTLGRDAHNQMEASRREFSKAIGAKRAEEVIFTASSTESIFLALAGLFNANNCKTIITSSIEHPAVLEAARSVAGKNNVCELKVDKWGFVSAEDLSKAISNCESPLVSIQMANSELASVQNISELAKVAHDASCLFHTDATQALGKVRFNAAELSVDAASFSSHKIGGPQGVGALYLKNSVKFSSPIVGGGQESKRRGGTQNVCGIVGFAAAAKAACENLDEEASRLATLKSKLVVSLSSLTTSANKNV
ncbi:MAG: aminotransferase class V-fold PLP-dependent enzyme, partial [Phoenicibacter congonensis]|nr:aminotransferase class V-fold PLP-dependent enzyme [Phoenicibacter congonensis]